MQVIGATSPGNPESINEDWWAATSELIVVLDGATARTDTGCRHGVAWYSSMLGTALQEEASDPGQALIDALSASIKWVANLHPECDLTYPGTPSAGVAVVRIGGQTLDYLVLGDVSIVLDTKAEPTIVSDHRISDTAVPARQRADGLPIGSAEKHAALLEMKHGELAARNRPGGYWIAAHEPEAAAHSITGQLPVSDVSRLAVLSDGAARLVDDFSLVTWSQALDLLESAGPEGFIETVREAEISDSRGKKWPRNKCSDDATAVYAARQEAPSKK